MTKKKSTEPVEQLAKAIEQKKSSQKNVFRGGNPPEGYRFAPGQSGNPQGRPSHSIYAQVLSDRMMRSCPPRKLCEAMGIDPSVTLGEAIMISLSNAAIKGDVSAAREVMAALGFHGTSAKNNVLVNVESPEQRGLTFEFLRHSHGIAEADMTRVFEFMDSLPREKPVVDASYLPGDEYRAGEPAKQLTEGREPE